MFLQLSFKLKVKKLTVYLLFTPRPEQVSHYSAAKMYKFKVHHSLHLLRSKYVTTRNIREPSSHPSPTQESTKLQGSFVNLSVWERQKQNFSLEEYVMINDCMKHKPSWKKEALKTVDLCFSRKHLCLCVYSDTCGVLK